MVKRTFTILVSVLMFLGVVAQNKMSFDNLEIITKDGKTVGAAENQLTDAAGESVSYKVYNPNENLTKTILSEFSKTQSNYDPGSLPEGEYLHDMAYSVDGSKVLIANRHSYILTVFDAATMDTIANIPVGYGALSIDVNANQAVVACLFDNVLTIIDLADYSTVNVSTSDSPTYVKINPSGTYAYVANESGVCEVVNLSTQSIENTISNFPVYTETLSWTTGSSRNFIKYNRFVFTQNGDYLAVADFNNNELEFYNTSSNTLETTLNVPGCRNLGVSPDGSIVYTTGNDNNAYRIDAINQLFIGNPVAIPDGASGGTKIVSNADGTKIYLGTGGNHGTLIDFVDEEAITYPTIYSAFWCDATHDNQYAVHGNFNFALVNFETETVEDVLSGYSQSIDVASPTAYEATSSDPLRFEGAYKYNFTSVSNIDMQGQYVPADGYEGDGPVRVKVVADGSKILMANNASQSVTVFNVQEEAIDTIFVFSPNADIKNVSATHDSQYGIVTFDDLGVAKIIDLNSLEIVASVSGGGHTIRVSSDNAYAYVSNVAGSDRINIIELDGANSSNIGSVITGQMGSTYAHFGILSDIQMSPDGNYIAIAVSFDDAVKIMDLSSNTIVQTLTNDFNFPLKLCFNDEGTKLAVTNYYGNTVTIIDFDGSSSSVQGVYPSGGEYPTRMAFNSITDEFYVCNNNSNNVAKIDPIDGSITGFINISGSPVNVAFDNAGNHIILSSGSDYHEIISSTGEAYEIPYRPANFDISPDDLTAVVSPGLDNLSIVEWTTTSVDVQKQSDIFVSPNPTDGLVTLDLVDIQNEGPVDVQLSDATGKIIAEYSNTENQA